MADLATELATYERELPSLLSDEGKFVLIKGDEIAGKFDSYQDALAAGYERFKLEPFLIKQIASTGQVAYFTRDLKLCPV